MAIKLDLSRVDRATAFNTWLSYQRISKRQLAEELGVTPWTMSRYISGERAPAEMIERMASMGIPRELLPAPKSFHTRSGFDGDGNT
jgi:hypothetical protein